MYLYPYRYTQSLRCRCFWRHAIFTHGTAPFTSDGGLPGVSFSSGTATYPQNQSTFHVSSVLNMRCKCSYKWQMSSDDRRIRSKALVIALRRCFPTGNGWFDEHLVVMMENCYLVPNMCLSCMLQSVLMIVCLTKKHPRGYGSGLLVSGQGWNSATARDRQQHCFNPAPPSSGLV